MKINKKRLFKALDKMLLEKLQSNKLTEVENKAIREFLRRKGYKI